MGWFYLLFSIAGMLLAREWIKHLDDIEEDDCAYCGKDAEYVFMSAGSPQRPICKQCAKDALASEYELMRKDR